MRENHDDLLLTKQDYDTLKSVLIIDSTLQNKVNGAKKKANKYIITLTRDELEMLAGYIAAEVNHAENKVKEQKLDELYDTKNCKVIKWWKNILIKS